jgi:hypothetical protein
MAVAGLGLLAAAGRARVGGQLPEGLLAGLPRAAAAVAVTGALAAVGGRLATDALLRHGSVGGATTAALLAGLVGAGVALSLLLVGLAVTDGGDLRAVLRRRPAPGVAVDRGVEGARPAPASRAEGRGAGSGRDDLGI